MSRDALKRAGNPSVYTLSSLGVPRIRYEDVKQKMQEKTLIVGKAFPSLLYYWADTFTIAGNNEERGKLRALVPTYKDEGANQFEMEYQLSS